MLTNMEAKTRQRTPWLRRSRTFQILPACLGKTLSYAWSAVLPSSFDAVLRRPIGGYVAVYMMHQNCPNLSKAPGA